MTRKITDRDPVYLSPRLVQVLIDGQIELVGTLRAGRSDRAGQRHLDRIHEYWEFGDAGPHPRPRYVMYDQGLAITQRNLLHWDYQSAADFNPAKAQEVGVCMLSTPMFVCAGLVVRKGRRWVADAHHTLHLSNVIVNTFEHQEQLVGLRDLIGKDAFYTQTNTVSRNGKQVSNVFIHCKRAEDAVLAKLFFERAQPLVMRPRQPV